MVAAHLRHIQLNSLKAPQDGHAAHARVRICDNEKMSKGFGKGSMAVGTDLAALGITAEMLAEYPLPRYAQASELVDAGEDMFGRSVRMTAATLAAWSRLRAAAERDGVTLQVVSAYRSFAYQYELIQRKLKRGDKIEDILQVNTIPGYSEHHTGQALDIHDGVGEPLTPAFASRQAFAWLSAHGGDHSFVLTYPRGNQYGIDYEPWHWCYQG